MHLSWKFLLISVFFSILEHNFTEYRVISDGHSTNYSKSSIKFDHVSPSHAGIYECIADNGLGSIIKTNFTLRIRGSIYKCFFKFIFFSNIATLRFYFKSVLTLITRYLYVVHVFIHSFTFLWCNILNCIQFCFMLNYWYIPIYSLVFIFNILEF